MECILSVFLKGWFITNAASSTCPGTELFCNSTWQHFLECRGSDDSPSILLISTLPLNSVAAYVMLSARSLLSFPHNQDAGWMQAPLSILCFCPLQSFPWRNKLIKSFLLYFFLIKQREDIAVAKVVIISNFVSCDTETSGNSLGFHKDACLRDSTVYYSSFAHYLVLHKKMC